jgi:ubiquinone/menaquinone biosynthesis C-methylase UbiE
MNPNKALWEMGDFTKIAESMKESGEALVSKLGVSKEHKVMDLGCGDGTTAIPMSKHAASVTGVDIARNLVEAGNLKVQSRGIDNCSFQEGDACDLQGIEDDHFDLSMSIFGAMFAPRPHDVAKEMVRVTKPGGRVVMGNWIPNDPTLVAQILKTCSAFTPPPPEGFISPMLWGVEDEVIDRFEKASVSKDNIAFSRESFTFKYPGSPEEYVGLFREFYGPTMNAYEAAKSNGKEEELNGRMIDLFKEHNQRPNHDGVQIDATFLRVIVQI